MPLVPRARRNGGERGWEGDEEVNVACHSISRCLAVSLCGRGLVTRPARMMLSVLAFVGPVVCGCMPGAGRGGGLSLRVRASWRCAAFESSVYLSRSTLRFLRWPPRFSAASTDAQPFMYCRGGWGRWCGGSGAGLVVDGKGIERRGAGRRLGGADSVVRWVFRGQACGCRVFCLCSCVRVRRDFTRFSIPLLFFCVWATWTLSLTELVVDWDLLLIHTVLCSLFSIACRSLHVCVCMCVGGCFLALNS